MKKLDGLRFLQENFPNLTVDCIFVDNENDLNEESLYTTDKKRQQWRVRAGHKIGSELNLPQGTFNNITDIRNFIAKHKKTDSNMEFVIHRVTPEYFNAPFVGTLAVYNDINNKGIRIELQRVTKQLLEEMDKGGKRPRDWESCLILDYDYLYKFPKVLKKDKELNMQFLKYPIMRLYQAGESIFRMYEKKGELIDTYTRFNIYDSGEILLDDHRSSDSFLERYKEKLQNNKGNNSEISEGFER